MQSSRTSRFMQTGSAKSSQISNKKLKFYLAKLFNYFSSLSCFQRCVGEIVLARSTERCELVCAVLTFACGRLLVLDSSYSSALSSIQPVWHCEFFQPCSEYKQFLWSQCRSADDFQACSSFYFLLVKTSL